MTSSLHDNSVKYSQENSPPTPGCLGGTEQLRVLVGNAGPDLVLVGWRTQLVGMFQDAAFS